MQREEYNAICADAGGRGSNSGFKGACTAFESHDQLSDVIEICSTSKSPSHITLCLIHMKSTSIDYNTYYTRNEGRNRIEYHAYPKQLIIDTYVVPVVPILLVVHHRLAFERYQTCVLDY
jgi:hypothetical protein